MTSRERTAWKDPALARLISLSTNTEAIHVELEQIKTETGEPQPAWIGEHVAVMKNGDYIVFEYRHGRNDFFPPHLFLGRTKTGEWLYSSYHFCNGLNMIRFGPQPASIAESRTPITPALSMANRTNAFD